jgi:hypothetical protein
MPGCIMQRPQASDYCRWKACLGAVIAVSLPISGIPTPTASRCSRLAHDLLCARRGMIIVVRAA